MVFLTKIVVFAYPQQPSTAQNYTNSLSDETSPSSPMASLHNRTAEINDSSSYSCPVTLAQKDGWAVANKQVGCRTVVFL